MAIEGPLKELGIHDVFQLLDLSRKTGVLTVTSKLRHNQGTVYFDNGYHAMGVAPDHPALGAGLAGEADHAGPRLDRHPDHAALRVEERTARVAGVHS